MSRIICGHFDESVKTDTALQALLAADFKRSSIDSFYTPPPGQNALHPLGGDVHSDAGARKSGVGAAVGGALGAAAGALIALVALRLGLLPTGDWAAPSLIFGSGLGGYIGSFIGAMKKMRHGSVRNATRQHPIEAPAGRMLAVLVEQPDTDTLAIEILRRNGARHVWRAEGTWRNGSWLDFDPRSPLAAV